MVPSAVTKRSWCVPPRCAQSTREAGVQLDDPVPLVDPQQVAVRIEVGAPPVLELRHLRVLRQIRPETAQGIAPAMESPAVQVHQHGLGGVARDVEIEPLEGGSRVALDHHRMVLRRTIPLEIGDRLDVGGDLPRRCRTGGRPGPAATCPARDRRPDGRHRPGG